MTTPARPAYLFYRWIWSGIDWLFPPYCGGCGRKGQRWCSNCQHDTHRLLPPICTICGVGIDAGNQCERCKRRTPHYTALRSWAAFDGPLRNALHRLKYQRDIALGDCLANELITYFVSLNWNVEMVVPVPLGVARLENRGYNQAALLARPLAVATLLHYEPNALIRSKETLSQVGLSASRRKENVSGAFEANQRLVSGQSVLVVDDVTTSGATLEACAEAMFRSGAKSVYCLTLARTL